MSSCLHTEEIFVRNYFKVTGVFFVCLQCKYCNKHSDNVSKNKYGD